MRRRRRSSFRKEKAIMLVSSCLVLTALTATGLYVRNRGQEKEEDNYIVDFTTLDEANRDKAGEAQDLGEQQADAGELDYDPSFQEANSGKVDNPDMKMLGSTANAGEQAAAEQAAAEAAQADAQQEALAQESQEALEANASDAIAKQTMGMRLQKRRGCHEYGACPGFFRVRYPCMAHRGKCPRELQHGQDRLFATLQQYKYNPAIIIAATQGEGITAAADGQVTTIYEDPEIGTAVIMNLGDGYELTYGQLTDLTVAEGDVVTTGEIIGKVAEPTKYYSVEGCNVYFKLTKDGQPVNPLNRLS